MKFCPLYRVIESKEKFGFMRCCEEECAWWIAPEQKCAVALLGWSAFFKMEESDASR